MISVLIPVFNTEKYLPACLDSVLSQSFEDFEVICIDDGSTDGSSSILENYCLQDLRITVYTQKNAGLSAARNKALELAKGEYVCFVDSDDILPSNSLKTLYSYTGNAEKKDFYDAVVGGVQVEYDVHEEMRSNDKYGFTLRMIGPHTPSDGVLWNFYDCSVACLFKLDTIKELDLRYPEGLHYEDAYWHWCFFLPATLSI